MPEGHAEVAAALRRLGHDYEAAASWHQPRDLARHRTAIAEAAIAGATTYPQTFDYPAAPPDYLADLAEIARLATRLEQPAVRAMILADLDDRRARARLALQRDDPAFATLEATRTGLPAPALVETARRVLDASAPAPTGPPSEDASERHSAETVAEAMRRALAAYDLTEWTVEVHDNMAARSSVNGGLRRVRLRAGERFSDQDRFRLVAHEIGGHVLRWANAAAQPEALAGLPLGRTVPAEEGLALWVEHTLAATEPARSATYALRVVAVDLARTLGILPLVRELARWAPVPEAVEVAVRVKRGLVDPNRPGGTTKDYGYLDGFQLVAGLDDEDREALQTVKWGAEHLPVARELLADGRLTRPLYTATREGLVLAET